MKLGMNLNIKPELKQKLAITPLLRQSLELLTYNMLELDHLIINEFEQNPLLKDSNYEEGSPGENKDNYDSEQSAETKEEPAEDIFEKYEINEEAWLNVFSEMPQSTGSSMSYTERPNLEDINSLKSTLKESLEWQLRLSIDNEEEFEIGLHIIGNLDSKGYISREDLDNIGTKLDADPDLIEAVRQKIKTFDPVGIASENIPECLIAQLKFHGSCHPDIEYLLTRHFENIKNSDYAPILKDSNIDINTDDLKFILDIISELDPKPGSHFDDREDNNIDIIPDILVKYESGEYYIELNESIKPMLYIPGNYKNLLANKAPEAEKDREFLKQKLARAQWLLKSIEQRRNTLMKVGNAFIKFQRDFLDKGPMHLRPMILKDIAEECDIHPSTVQRIVTQKFIDTPRGVYLLKYFFSRAIPKKDGNTVSNISIKKDIESIIKNEDKEKPFSDAEIQVIMQEKGIKISRRGIAKYRTELGILNSNKRKKKVL